MKKVSLLMAALMLLTSVVGCAPQATEEKPAEEQSAEQTGAEASSVVCAGTGYESEDNSMAVTYLSDAPEGLAETAVPDTLTVANIGEPVNLYPYTANQMPAVNAMTPMYEPLIRYNTFSGEYEPCLAESWEWIDDSTLRLHLRQGVKCHAGYDFTASDVLWSAQQGVESSVSNYIWGMFDVENWEIQDDYTIDVKTFGPFGPIFAYLSDTSVGLITDQQAYEEQTPEEYSRNPTGGYGPYQFVEWVAGDHITYKRFEDYYGAKPYYANLVLRNIADDVARALALEAGEVDVIYNVDTASAQNLIDSPAVDVITFPAYFLIHIGFNSEVKPFDDVRVRQALRYALDLDSIVNLAFNGFSDVADGAWPKAFSAYEPNTNPETAYEYNPEKAKELLAEAGYADGFEFEMIVQDTAAWVQMAEMVQNAYAAIGVKANVQVVDNNTLTALRSEGKYEAYLARFSFSGDDASFTYMRYYSDEPWFCNTVRYNNPEVDDLLDKANASLDEDFRMECYHKIQEIVRAELPYNNLACPLLIHAVRSTLHGMPTHAYGPVDVRYIRPKTVD